MLSSLALMILWLTRFVFVLLQYRGKGLWFLAGLPLGVLLPYLVFVFWWACAFHGACL